MAIGIFVALLLTIFSLSRVPDLHVEDEDRKFVERQDGVRPSRTQQIGIAVILAAVCGLLYFFIAPILTVMWRLLHMGEALLQPSKVAILIVAYVAAVAAVSRKWDLFRRKHFTLGIAAQFFYVAAQTGIFSFCVNYILENDPGVTRLQASKWLGVIGFGLFMIGRLGGSAVISQFQPHRVLATYAAINVALVAVTMGGGKAGLYAMFATFFLYVDRLPHNLCAWHPRVGRTHETGIIAHRHVYCRRSNCSAVHGPYCGSAFVAHWLCSTAGLFRVCRSLRLHLGKTQQSGFVAWR